MTEFILGNHIRMSTNKLRKLRQTSSVLKYLAEFCNIVQTNLDIADGEKWDELFSCLKHDLRIELLRSLVLTFEEAAKLSLRVDSAV